MKPDISALKVLLYGHQIGTIFHLPGDKNFFSFEQTYIADPKRPILSLSFKDFSGDLISDVKITKTRLPPFFSNLLPEGPLQEYLAKRAHLNPLHEFYLLWALGGDLPGAITIQSENSISPLLDREKARLKNINNQEMPLRFSLAGVQLKFSAIKKLNHGLIIPGDGVGGEWIIKLPHSTFKGVPENEYTMMELARKIGIDVPETLLLPIQEIEGLPDGFEKLGENVFAIKRFDRMENGNKFHMEDFAQVFGVYPEKKYKDASYCNIAEVIQNETGELGTIEFIKRFVFNALIGNGDMHLKNWSLLYKEIDKPTLAPAYDFVSTILYLPEDKLALNFVDNKDFSSLTMNQFKRFAAKASISERLIIHTVEETIEAFSEAWKNIHDLPLQTELYNAISKHLQNLPIWHTK